jgi:AcrR family transcriptional regulator
MQKEQKTDRRTQILAVAREVLAEKGLEATKVSEIVKRTGIAQGTFYLYFESKNSVIEALAKEMTDNVFESVRQSLAESKSFESGIENGLKAAFHSMSDYRNIFTILINGCAVAAADPTEWEALFAPYYELLENYIRQWQADGEVDPQFNPKIISRLIISLSEQAVDDYYIHESDTPVDTYIANVTRFVIKALRI